jgi:hypothetical protein
MQCPTLAEHQQYSRPSRELKQISYKQTQKQIQIYTFLKKHWHEIFNLGFFFYRKASSRSLALINDVKLSVRGLVNLQLYSAGYFLWPQA